MLVIEKTQPTENQLDHGNLCGPIFANISFFTGWWGFNFVEEIF